MKSIHTTIHIPAPAKLVWDTLVDFSGHNRWNPLFASIQGQATLGARLRIAARRDNGEAGMVFRPQILTLLPQRRLGWRGSLFVRGLFDGQHSFELHEQPDQSTKLIHEEHFSGLLVPLMGGLIRQTKQGFERFNQALAQEVLAKQT